MRFSLALVLIAIWFLASAAVCLAEDLAPRPWVAIRGIYGGVPSELMAGNTSLTDHGVNAVWIGSGGLTEATAKQLKGQKAKVFAEFNTMHDASLLREFPDAAPVGADGATAPPPDGWQGICPNHRGYREARMKAFRAALQGFAIDGIWLDYHHAQASWEQAVPNLPDTCFCRRCRVQFQKDTGIRLPDEPIPDLARRLLGPLHEAWVNWRCEVFTDWVREFAAIRDEVRPLALLGTFHCPWSDTDFDGALREKLAIDLKAQSQYLDVLSPMPYHARFGHVSDPSWISRQTAWLGGHLGIRGEPGERLKIWPIAQLSDWGEPVPAAQVETVIDHAARRPSTGVMVFAWGSLRQSPEKVERMSKAYQAIQP